MFFKKKKKKPPFSPFSLNWARGNYRVLKYCAKC